MAYKARMQHVQSYQILVRGENFQLDPDSDERYGFYSRRLAMAEDTDTAIEKVMDIIRREFHDKVHNRSVEDMPRMYVDEVKVVEVASYKSIKKSLGETEWFLEGEEQPED